MNCERFQTVVNDLAREQMMDAGARNDALTHAQECEPCASRWEDERSLSAGLWSLSEDMKSLVAPPRLEAQILQAFRERKGGASRLTPVVTPIQVQTRRPLPRYWVAAIAALLLVVFGIFVVRGRVPSQNAIDGTPAVPSNAKQPAEDQRPDFAAKEKSVPSPIEDARPGVDGFQRIVNPPRTNRGRHTNAQDSAAALGVDVKKDEVATAFFPLTYGSPPNLQEGGQLMRVELPRDAVARFGLPVNMDRSNQRVKADVLVGSDGLAQAIRFVH